MASFEYDGGLTAAYSVKDLDKAIEWYQDVLGFKLLYKMDEISWCELSTGVAHVNVGLSGVEEVPAGGGATLTFGVKNIDAARAELEGKGVKFDGETRVIEGMVKLATFFDPDANVLMFFQDLSK
jgi:catechol 2,3-dioxygenase-like lactoylglutathione lyase family enzyme